MKLNLTDEELQKLCQAYVGPVGYSTEMVTYTIISVIIAVILMIRYEHLL